MLKTENEKSKRHQETDQMSKSEKEIKRSITAKKDHRIIEHEGINTKK